MMSIRLAWRNLWRNRSRTAVSVATLSTGTAVLIVISSLILGLVEQIVSRITRQGTGEVQVHAVGYRARRALQQTIHNPERILEAASRLGIAAAPRAMAPALLSVGSKSAGARLMGIHPDAERAVGDLPRRIESGVFLEGGTRKGLVLGHRLARSLDAKLGGEVIIVVQAVDGSVRRDLFQVAGILASVSEMVDRSSAFVLLDEFEGLAALPDQLHEISLSSNGTLRSEEVAAAIASAAGDNEVKTWRQLMPTLVTVVDVWNGVGALLGAIFFLAAGLGVVNTMLMSSYERIPEFGLIKALGSTPMRIVRDMATEALLLGVVSTALGALVGLTIALYAQQYGLDISSFAGSVSFSGVAMESLWKAQVTPVTVLKPIFIMLTVSVLSALYPAIKAARLDPVQAMVHV